MMLKYERSKNGFSLIELLICTAILSFSLIMMYRPMFSALNSLRYSDEREEAERFLEQQVFEFREKTKAEQKRMSLSETRTLLGRDKPFVYLLTAQSYAGDETLYRIDCQISWKRAGVAKRLLRSFDAYIPKNPAA